MHVKRSFLDNALRQLKKRSACPRSSSIKDINVNLFLIKVTRFSAETVESNCGTVALTLADKWQVNRSCSLWTARIATCNSFRTLCNCFLLSVLPFQVGRQRHSASLNYSLVSSFISSILTQFSLPPQPIPPPAPLPLSLPINPACQSVNSSNQPRASEFSFSGPRGPGKKNKNRISAPPPLKSTTLNSVPRCRRPLTSCRPRVVYRKRAHRLHHLPNATPCATPAPASKPAEWPTSSTLAREHGQVPEQGSRHLWAWARRLHQGSPPFSRNSRVSPIFSFPSSISHYFIFSFSSFFSFFLFLLIFLVPIVEHCWGVCFVGIDQWIFEVRYNRRLSLLGVARQSHFVFVYSHWYRPMYFNLIFFNLFPFLIFQFFSMFREYI